MTLTLNNFVGFETGGLEEASSLNNNPLVQSGVVRTGAFALQLGGSGLLKRFNVGLLGTDAGDKYIAGFAFRTTDKNPGSQNGPFTARDTNNIGIIGLRLKPNGDVHITDVSFNDVAMVTDPFTVNIWHYIELIWENTNAGSAELFIDGLSVASVASADFDTGLAISDYRLRGPGSTEGTYYFDDVYLYSGAADSDDRLGNNTEVLGAYQNTVEDALDQGDALEAGTWAITGDSPGVDDGTPAQYTSTPRDGHTICDEGARPGPSTAGEGTGIIKGGKWLHRLRRSSGGGTTHSIRYGHNGDTVLETVTLDTSYENFITIKDNTVAQVPTSSEDFAQGFKVDGPRSIECADMWAFLLHVDEALPPPPPGPSRNLANSRSHVQPQRAFVFNPREKAFTRGHAET